MDCRETEVELIGFGYYLDGGVEGNHFSGLGYLVVPLIGIE